MQRTDTILDRIVADKQRQLAAARRARPLTQLEKMAAAVPPFAGPGFYDVLKAPAPAPKLIAEVKQASPSRGVIRNDFSLEEINAAYQASPHVVALSVLTEPVHFRGSEATLSFFAAHNERHKPLLRKDFIFDPYQVVESKVLGAQAYLLIASLFDDAQALDELITLGQELGLEALVEVHTKEELALVQATAARVVGVNARDLRTFKIDLTAHELLRELDDTYAKVAESGIETAAQLAHVAGFCDAALVGSHLMAAEDIGAAIEALVSSAEAES